MGNLASSASQTIKFSSPSLYESCAWPPREVKKMVFSNKLAPLFPPVEELEEDQMDEMEECPVCMLFYTSLNRVDCCRKRICSECFLQWQLPQFSKDCPFCMASAFTVSFEGPLSSEEREREKDEQRKVLQLEAKMRAEEIERDSQRIKANQEKLRREADALQRVSGHGDTINHADEERPDDRPHFLGDILEVEMLMLNEEDEFTELKGEEISPIEEELRAQSSLSIYIPDSPTSPQEQPVLPILQSCGQHRLNADRATSAAVFGATRDSVVVVGLQKVTPDKTENSLFMGRCANPGSLKTIRKTFSITTADKVRTVKWTHDQGTVVFSAGSKIGALSRGTGGADVSWVRCDHGDEIRDMALNQRDWSLSCGFDGKLNVSDTRAQAQLMGTTIGNVMGSCKWYDENVASATTDCGDWFMIDTRAKPEVESASLPNISAGLYAHTFFDKGRMICLGFGFGKIITMDMRMLDMRIPVFECQDPAVHSIGEMITTQNNSIIVTGEDSITLYRSLSGGSLGAFARGKPPEFGGSVGLQTKAHISSDSERLFVTDSTANVNMYHL